jgi:hypothetical protein
MVMQAVFVGVQSLLLYVITVGISDMQFKEPFSKVLCLNMFNDYSEELEMNL